MKITVRVTRVISYFDIRASCPTIENQIFFHRDDDGLDLDRQIVYSDLNNSTSSSTQIYKLFLDELLGDYTYSSDDSENVAMFLIRVI